MEPCCPGPAAPAAHCGAELPDFPALHPSGTPGIPLAHHPAHGPAAGGGLYALPLHRESGPSPWTCTSPTACWASTATPHAFYAASWLNARRRGNGIRLIGFGGATLLFSLLLGTYALPAIRASLSHGTTVNYLFALLAVTILLSSSAYVFLLEQMGFWEAAPPGRPARPTRPLPGAFSPVIQIEAAAGPWEAWGGQPASAGSPEPGRLRTAFPPARADPPAGLHRGHAGPKAP